MIIDGEFSPMAIYEGCDKNEESEPYCYPDSFIQLPGYMRSYFHLPYRQTQNVVIAHANKLRNIPHFSTTNRRLNRLEIKINERLGNNIVIALDSTRITLANR